MPDDINSEFAAALQSYNHERVRAALARGPDLSVPLDQYGQLPTHRLMAYGADLLKEALAHGLDVNAICYAGDAGWTLLMGAVGLGKLDCVKLLLERGADIHHKDSRGHSVIDHLNLTNKYSPWAEIVTVLIDAGVDVNSHCHVSPLEYCDDKNVPAAKVLIKHGLNVNFRSQFGTALHGRVEGKSKKMIELLLASGADPNLTTGQKHEHPGLTALELARTRKLKPIIALLEEKLGAAQPEPEVAPLTWAQFAQAVKKAKHAKRLMSLRGPADETALSKLDKVAGGELPGDFHSYLSVNDGQDGGETIVGNPDEPKEPFVLLPVGGIADQLIWFKKNAKELAGEFDEISADDGVKAVYWNAKWIPFAHNGAGDFLCLDMSPTKHGRVGQIILLDHENPHRAKLADSFGLLLARWAEAIEG